MSQSKGHQSNRWKEPMVLSTIAIAIATVVNLSFSFMLWRANNEYTRYFKTSNRPIVGALGVHQTNDLKGKKFHFEVEVKNVGPVPARRVIINHQVLMNGRAVPAIMLSDLPIILMPQEHCFRIGTVFGEEYDRLLNGSSSLEIDYNINYEGYSGEQYKTKGKYKYVKETSGFVTINAEAD